MLKLILTSFSVALILFGCSKPLPTDDVINYHLDFDEAEHTPFTISVIADSISYIQLETTPESLLSQISGCGFCDSGIVVFDQRGGSVLLFSRNGDFIRPIGSRGEGPDEYMRPDAIDVDRNIVYIYSGIQSSILKYALDGSFIGADSIGSIGDFVHCSSEGSDSYLVALCEESDERGLYLVHTAPYVSRKIVSAVNDLPGTCLLNLFRYGDDEIAYMANSFDNRVYQWNTDTITSIYVLDITPMPSPDQIDNILGRESVNYYNRMAFYSSPRWLLVNYWRAPEDFRTVIVDKTQDAVRVTRRIINDLDSFPQGYGVKGGCNGDLLFALDDPATDSNPRLQILHLKK